MWARVAAAIVFILLQTSLHAQAEKRIALLIGNRDYRAGVGSLTNPLNDIRIVGEALKSVGFEVLKPVENAQRSAMLIAIHAFASKLKTAGPEAVGFLYYSGHGIASAGENYLIPTDVDEPSTVLLSVQGVKQSEVLAILRGEAPNAAHYLVLDACRNTLQGARGGKGFVPVGQQSGVLVAFATEPGRTASDTGQGSGPYAAALAEELIKPVQNDLLMFHNIRVAVIEKTGGDQVPWTEDGIQRPRRVIFGGEGKLEQPTSMALPAASLRLSEAAEAWDRTKDTTSIATLEAFIRRFGDSYYGDLAKARLEEIKLGSSAIIGIPRGYPDLTTTDCHPARATDIATRACSSIIAQFPTFAAAYAIRGLSYRRQGERGQAQADFDRALGLDPKNTYALSGRFCTLARAGDDATAQADFDRLSAINPAQSMDFYTIGLAYLCKRDYDHAITDFSKAIDLDPKFAVAYDSRGFVYANHKKDYDRAIVDLDKAIELDPKFANAYTHRGLAHAGKKNYDRAFADHNRAIELDPKSTSAYNNRGLAYAGKRDYDDAITDYSKAIDLDPKLAVAYSNRGFAYANHKKDYDRAIVDLNKAIELDPKFANAYSFRGLAHAGKKDYDRAFADHNRAIELDPKSASAYNNRGLAYEKKYDNALATADFRKALELDPNLTIARENLRRLGLDH
jgi:tetratricopeptide (TPR) repeat protein